jgi:hypothetical protein
MCSIVSLSSWHFIHLLSSPFIQYLFSLSSFPHVNLAIIFLSLALSLPRYSGISSVIHLSYSLIFIWILWFFLAFTQLYLFLSFSIFPLLHWPWRINYLLVRKKFFGDDLIRENWNSEFKRHWRFFISNTSSPLSNTSHTPCCSCLIPSLLSCLSVSLFLSLSSTFTGIRVPRILFFSPIFRQYPAFVPSRCVSFFSVFLFVSRPLLLWFLFPLASSVSSSVVFRFPFSLPEVSWSTLLILALLFPRSVIPFSFSLGLCIFFSLSLSLSPPLYLFPTSLSVYLLIASRKLFLLILVLFHSLNAFTASYSHSLSHHSFFLFFLLPWLLLPFLSFLF